MVMTPARRTLTLRHCQVLARFNITALETLIGITTPMKSPTP
jgi:hypothetical protein